MTDTIKILAHEVNGVEKEYGEEITLSLENIVTENGFLGQADLTQVLNFIRNNASLNNFVEIANNMVQTNASAFVDIPNMSITPDVAGEYIIISAIKTYHAQANRYGYYDLTFNGVQIANTQTELYFASKDLTLTALNASKVTVNGTTDNIKMRWYSSAGNLVGQTRFMLMFRVA